MQQTKRILKTTTRHKFPFVRFRLACPLGHTTQLPERKKKSTRKESSLFVFAEEAEPGRLTSRTREMEAPVVRLSESPSEIEA